MKDLTKAELGCYRLMRLCAAPEKVYSQYFSLLDFKDADGNDYAFLLNKLRQKGYIDVDVTGNKIRILK